jgi:diguanylate cyclase (GGDEF)-like protein
MRATIRKAPQAGPVRIVSPVAPAIAPVSPPPPMEILARIAADLQRARHQFLEALPVAAAVVDHRGDQLCVEHCNKAYVQLDKAHDIDTRTILERCDFADQISAFLKGDEEIRQLDWSDGGPIVGKQFTVRLARVPSIETGGYRCLMTLLDRTAEVQTAKSLRLEMFNDSLTGLYNRAGFSEQLEHLIADKELDEENYAILIVDLARFSRINESIGTLSGDELLITAARRLLGSLRAGDVIARTGGDQFALLVRLHDGPGDALHVAQRITEIFARPYRLSELEVRVDAAIGCALGEQNCDVEEIFRRAQFSVKRAKTSGRIEVYQPVAFTRARNRFSMETALRRAIEGDKLRLAFQPLIDLATGAVSGFETLARWTDGEQGEIPPTEFIPVAEESGLIVPLGRWAVDQALQTLAGWDACEGRTLPLHLAVNISAVQIVRDDVAGIVDGALARAGLTGDRLILELTESTIIADPDRAARVMNGLKAQNATLAMDDFGTGYSNLASLHRLPIDILKIDRSFITGMLADRDKVAIVRAILSLARALGLETTAEGIETVELSQTLAALGCTHGQGFFYSPPLSADEALAYWRSART